MTGGAVSSIAHRQILDSHMGFTTEFILQLEDGSTGVGSSSQGETISIYEDRGFEIDPGRIVESVKQDGIIGAQMDQCEFDAYLHGKIADFGRNNCFALSLAHFDALSGGVILEPGVPCVLPRLCLNVLNGGFHAYTNPVLSDISEFMIVPRGTNVRKTLREHNRIQGAVRERLLRSDKTTVNGNPVNFFGEKDNLAPMRLLVDVLEELGLRDDYDLMLDASAGDLRVADGYAFPITDGKRRTSDELLAYWLDLVEAFSIGFLEDPFHEEDYGAWSALTKACGERCQVIGDNLYSSEVARIEMGTRERLSTAAIVKPNQAGTVTATIQAIEAANAGGLMPITSHRSISTESTFVCDVTCKYGVPYIKIGPLLTDYSSVIRLNRLLRLAGDGSE